MTNGVRTLVGHRVLAAGDSQLCRRASFAPRGVGSRPTPARCARSPPGVSSGARAAGRGRVRSTAPPRPRRSCRCCARETERARRVGLLECRSHVGGARPTRSTSSSGRSPAGRGATMGRQCSAHADVPRPRRPPSFARPTCRRGAAEAEGQVRQGGFVRLGRSACGRVRGWVRACACVLENSSDLQPCRRPRPAWPAEGEFARRHGIANQEA